MIGFTATDFTGLTSYTGTLPSGKEFIPQFILQEFVDFDNNIKSSQASVNESGSGVVEVISFGRIKFMECNVRFQTNTAMPKNAPIDNDSSGVANLRDFLDDATLKGDLEFIPDRDDPDTFTTCLLESTPESREGVDFKLKEQFGDGLAGYFQSGKLIFREVER